MSEYEGPNLIDKMGGRKFVMTLVVILVGTAVQILHPAGMTETFTALLLGASATFGVTNAFVTKKSIEAEGSPAEQLAGAPPADSSAVDELREQVRQIAMQAGQGIMALEKSIAEANEKTEQLAAHVTQVAETTAATGKLVKAAITMNTGS